ncbi:GAF domain-containing protein [Streptomyces sp. MAR4 CNX-425]|uniref:GAF domain-containing protein n=1 Tax=Streptomyces sp. MAR4 CNX-425 TaxID=3406343 RepID=UPI003B5139EC
MTDRFTVRQSVFDAVADSGPGELPGRLCRLLCAELDLDAVAISLLSHTPYRQVYAASDATALRVAELQFELLEGPSVRASAHGRPVVVPDLHGGDRRWPAFGARAREELPEAGAVYAFPMRFRRRVLGAVCMVRRTPGSLTGAGYERCAIAADAVAVALLDDFHRLFHRTVPHPRSPD